MSSTLPPSPRAILTSLTSGLHYGLKIRLPHALIMTFIFSSHLPLREKIKKIISIAGTHAGNLGCFAAAYTCCIELLKLVDPIQPTPFLSTAPDTDIIAAYAKPGRPLKPYHSIISGGLGGWLIWSNYSQVNYQIIQYIVPRITITMLQVLSTKYQVLPFKKFGGQGSFTRNYKYLAIVVWSCAMYLYEFERDDMNVGLQKSMEEVYGNRGINFRSYIGFFRSIFGGGKRGKKRDEDDVLSDGDFIMGDEMM